MVFCVPHGNFKKNEIKIFVYSIIFIMPVSMPIYYSVSGSDRLPFPSTGTFGSMMGSQSTATSRVDAEAKARASSFKIPGKQIWGADVKSDGYVIKYQDGGKRKKTKSTGRKTRRNKTRRRSNRKNSK